MQDLASEHLAGSVERVTFHSEASGFCVLRVKVKGQRDLITVVGSTASVSPGEFIEAHGHWVNDATHGQQFKANPLRVVPPTNLEGIEKYLGSGMVKGIGPHFARKRVRAFGETVFDVIETTPERLQELDGIGPKRQARVTAAGAEQKVIREIMVFLQSHGVGTARAVRIDKTYGDEAIERAIARRGVRNWSPWRQTCWTFRHRSSRTPSRPSWTGKTWYWNLRTVGR